MKSRPDFAAAAIHVEGSREHELIWLSEPKVEGSLDQPACSMGVDLVFKAKIAAFAPAVMPEDDGREKYTFNAEFRLRYIIGLWGKFCSLPFVGRSEDFPSDIVKEQKLMRTDKYLLPVIKSSEYAEIARKMLSLYYPEALDHPTAIDGLKLADAMGLTVKEVELEPGSDIYGSIFFEEKWVTVYDNGLPHPIKVFPMTVLINTNLCTTPVLKNSTIVHECSHAYLDYTFFLLQRIAGSPYTSFNSRRGARKTYNNDDPISWMELQARKLSAYVLLNEDSTRSVINHYFACFDGIRSPEVVFGAVETIASIFYVSLSMAKYRMIELGYPEAEGVYAYVDNMRVPDYGCKSWNPYTTYIISRSDAAVLLDESKEFRNALNSGCYIYAEGHYCLKDEAYINAETRSLTSYAREHIDECCLSFTFKGRHSEAEYGFGYAARKKESKYQYRCQHDFDSEPKSKERVVQNNRFTKDALIWDELLCNLPVSFRQAVQMIIDKKGITQNELAMRIGVSRGTLIKWLSGKPSLRHVVAICIGIHVRGDVGYEIVKRSGNWFSDSFEDRLLKAMMYEGENIDIETANEIMIQNNLLPLTEGKGQASA